MTKKKETVFTHIENNKPQVTSVETRSSQTEQDKKTVDEFLQNPEMKKQAGVLAFQIQKEFSNWFSVQQITKKFKTDLAEASRRIEMLMLFNYCIGKVEKGKPFF